MDGFETFEFGFEGGETVGATSGDDDFLADAVEVTSKGFTKAGGSAEDEDGVDVCRHCD